MKYKCLITSCLLIAASLAAGCNGGGEPAPPGEETAEQEPVDVNSVTLDPEKLQRIRIGHATLINLADKLQVPSQVEVDEYKLVRVGANVTGRIVEVYAMLGDSIRAGDALARIASPELTQAQLAYLRASSRTTLAEKAAERAQHLLAADVIPLAEVERRESELQVAHAELDAAKDQLRLLGVDDGAFKALTKGANRPFGCNQNFLGRNCH